MLIFFIFLQSSCAQRKFLLHNLHLNLLRYVKLDTLSSKSRARKLLPFVSYSIWCGGDEANSKHGESSTNSIFRGSAQMCGIIGAVKGWVRSATFGSFSPSKQSSSYVTTVACFHCNSTLEVCRKNSLLKVTARLYILENFSERAQLLRLLSQSDTCHRNHTVRFENRWELVSTYV